MNRWILLTLGALWLIPAGALAQDSDRAALLEGVKEIVAPGCIPGDLVVFGDRATVVMTGKMGRANLPMIAAARYGRGRAVITGHEGFFGGAALRNPDNLRLSQNVAQWTPGKPLAGLRVCVIGQDSALVRALRDSGCRAATVATADVPERLNELDLLWLNQASLDGPANRSRIASVRRWVARGGGLVVTGPAWGWQSLNPSLDLGRDHSGNQLALPMGIGFGTGMLGETRARGYTTEVGTGQAHAARALALLEEQAAGKAAPTPAEIQQVSVVLSQAVGALPDSRVGILRRVDAICAGKGGDVIPSHQSPITQAMPFARLKATLDWQRIRGLPPGRVRPHPASVSFPGSVPAAAKRITRTIPVDTRIPGWHGTGLYAAPGEAIQVSVPKEAAGKGLAIRIGAHTDTLWHLDRWERFPEVCMSRPLNAQTQSVASPFGGSVFVDVPEQCKLGHIAVTVSHAVAAPLFVRGAAKLEEWQASRIAPGPWAEMEGRLVALTLPSYAIRDLDDPESLMAYWDEVVEKCCELYAAPRPIRPERYCVDRQISAGYMHSGYPIMTWEDVARTFCDLKTLRGGSGIKVWGFYHELGHNFQRPEWTWDGMGEVTNNLFALYGTEKINGVTVGAHPAMTQSEIEKRIRVVAANPGTEAYYLRDPWYPLTMFYLLRREFGWDPFTKVFAEFRDLPASERPRADEQKRDQFLIRFSRAVGRNLSDYLSAWGVVTSQSARDSVSPLPTWMPEHLQSP